MEYQSGAILLGTTVASTASPTLLAGPQSTRNTYRVIADAVIHFACLSPEQDSSILTAIAGAPLAANSVEFIDVPKGYSLYSIGAANVSVNLTAKI